MGVLGHSMYVYTSPPFSLSSILRLSVPFMIFALSYKRLFSKCPPTLPKSTRVKRVITGDVVASGRTDAHTVDPIGTSKAAGSTWIAAEEGSCEGVGGHDGKPGLASRAVSGSNEKPTSQ